MSHVLVVGAATATGFAAARIVAGDGVEVAGIRVDVDLAWVVLLAVTVVHVWLAVFFLAAIHRLWQAQDQPAQGQRVFDEIALESSIVMRGMLPRVRRLGSHTRVYQMEWSDPSTWVALAAALVATVAVLPWRILHGELVVSSTTGAIAMVAFAVSMVVVNWVVGATWSVALSQLTVPTPEATWHLARRKSKWRRLSRRPP